MKYYKNTKINEVYAYESDGSQDEFIFPELVPMTDEEVYDHLNKTQEPPTITEISTAQGHLALIEFGKYQDAVEFINAITDPVEKLKAEVNFFRRNDWQRDNPTLLALAQGLGISDAELDQMFIFGSTQ